MTDRLIATIPKNGREDVRIALRDFHGRRAIDVRVFAETGQGRAPSPKGLSVQPGQLKALIAALIDAERAAIEEGLIVERGD